MEARVLRGRAREGKKAALPLPGDSGARASRRERKKRLADGGPYNTLDRKRPDRMLVPARVTTGIAASRRCTRIAAADAVRCVMMAMAVHHVVMVRSVVMRVHVGATTFTKCRGLRRHCEETACDKRRRHEKTLEHGRSFLEEPSSGAEKARSKRTMPSFVQARIACARLVNSRLVKPSRVALLAAGPRCLPIAGEDPR